MLKVGKDHIIDKKTNKKKLLSYVCVPDKDGWVNSEEYLPADFDLVTLLTHENKTLKGWVNGRSWDGAKVNSKLIITHWKKPDEGNGIYMR